MSSSLSAQSDIIQEEIFPSSKKKYISSRELQSNFNDSNILGTMKICSRHTIFDLIILHAPISAQSNNLAVFRIQPVYFFLLLYKNICCGYSFELPRLTRCGYSFELPPQVKAIQTSTHNICFYKENQSHKHH